MDSGGTTSGLSLYAARLTENPLPLATSIRPPPTSMSEPKRAAAAVAETYRQFPGRRWMISLLRVLHLAGVVGVGAGLLVAAPVPAYHVFIVLLVGSGVAMLALDFWSNASYARQLAGVMMFAKLVLLVWFAFDPARRAWLFWTTLAFSTLLAHAPGRFRHRTLFGRIKGK